MFVTGQQEVHTLCRKLRLMYPMDGKLGKIMIEPCLDNLTNIDIQLNIKKKRKKKKKKQLQEHHKLFISRQVYP